MEPALLRERAQINSSQIGEADRCRLVGSFGEHGFDSARGIHQDARLRYARPFAKAE